MPRYDKVWANLAERAVLQGGINADTFVKQARDAGVPDAKILELVELDLINEGSLFGPFLRSLTGASTATVTAAAHQGEIVGHVAEDKALRELMDLADLDDVIDDAISGADPDLAADIEAASEDRLEMMWVATLVNTCHRCLPLHGTIRTVREWKELNLHPTTIHDGWASDCKCRFVAQQLADRTEMMTPLKRNKVISPTGLKGSKRTMRGVAQVDLDKAMASRDKAMESLEGRRTLRLLGKSAQPQKEKGK